MQKFWMVLGSFGSPAYRHPTEHSAKQEAERLAKLNAGQEFIVLESIASAVKAEVQWSEHYNADMIPF